MNRNALILLVALPLLAPGDPPGTAARAEPAWMIVAPPGSRDGRSGNASLRRGEPAEAADRFRRGLDRSGPGGRATSGLANNLGVTYFEQGDPDEALRLFALAEDAAASPGEAARAAFNAATVLAAQGHLERALARYRGAMLLLPDFPEARYNYEVVARRLAQEAPEPTVSDADQGATLALEASPVDGVDPPGQDSADPADGPGETEPDDGRASDGETEDGSEDGDEAGEGQSTTAAPRPEPSSLTPEEADRILRAIEAEEQDVLRDVHQRRFRGIQQEKDW